MRSRRHPAGCAHCEAVRRPHPAGCAHCEAVRRPHPAGCAHCEAVRRIAAAYWLWRQTAESAREAACYGYRTEEREYGALPTFRDYLIQTAGERAAYERALELEKEGAA